jgi:hypothetical protein
MVVRLRCTCDDYLELWPACSTSSCTVGFRQEVTSGWESRDLPMVGCHITPSSPLQTSTFPRHWPARLLLWAQLRRVLVPSQDVSRVEKSIHSAEYGLDIRC